MKRTGNDYTKPYAKEIFGVENMCCYPYPREELIKQSVFPYFVLDGGSFNLLNDRFGTAEGDRILELTMSGELFDVFRHKGEFNWETSFAYTSDTSFTKKYEWQIWPQRLYMTIPLAHRFLQTGDVKYANAWLKIVKEWDKAHPYQEFDPSVHYMQTDMTWRDMQVAWRTMSLLHGLFMLNDAPFDVEEWRYLYDFVILHMKHLYVEALDRLARNYSQNHVLQIGVVLMFAAVMFPEAENAEEMLKIGRDTVEMNLRNAVFADGGSDEDSPSYNNFIARLYLEALLLIENNNLAGIDGLRESIINQYRWIYQCMTPRGKSLQLSDSYAIDVQKDLDYVSRLIDLDLPDRCDNVLLPDSRMAIFRKGDITLYVDAQRYPGPHHHAGTPQILLFKGSEPLIVDSGVCNYDRWELYELLPEPKMHNVVYAEDIYSTDMTIEPHIEFFDGDNGIIKIKTEVENGKRKYTWIRNIQVDDNKLVICDEAESCDEQIWHSRLFFRKNDVYFPGDKRSMQLLTEDFIMTLESDLSVEKELVPVMNDGNRLDYAVVVQNTCYGKKLENKIEIVFEKR